MSTPNPRQRALYVVIVAGICAAITIVAGGVSAAQRPALLAAPAVEQVAPKLPQPAGAPAAAPVAVGANETPLQAPPASVPAGIVVLAGPAAAPIAVADDATPVAAAEATARAGVEELAITGTAGDLGATSLEDQVAPAARGPKRRAAAGNRPERSAHGVGEDVVEVDHSISTIPASPDVSASDTTTTVEMERPDEPDDPWAGVRRCESHNNYSINTGNGFYGAYQFTISSWDWVAGLIGRDDLVGVRPDLASPADQDRLAQALGFEVAGGGLGHWPVCGKYYG